jgi:hypothetical protein
MRVREHTLLLLLAIGSLLLSSCGSDTIYLKTEITNPGPGCPLEILRFEQAEYDCVKNEWQVKIWVKNVSDETTGGYECIFTLYDISGDTIAYFVGEELTSVSEPYIILSPGDSGLDKWIHGLEESEEQRSRGKEAFRVSGQVSKVTSIIDIEWPNEVRHEDIKSLQVVVKQLEPNCPLEVVSIESTFNRNKGQWLASFKVRNTTDKPIWRFDYALAVTDAYGEFQTGCTEYSDYKIDGGRTYTVNVTKTNLAKSDVQAHKVTAFITKVAYGDDEVWSVE